MVDADFNFVKILQLLCDTRIHFIDIFQMHNLCWYNINEKRFLAFCFQSRISEQKGWLPKSNMTLEQYIWSQFVTHKAKLNKLTKSRDSIYYTYGGSALMAQKVIERGMFHVKSYASNFEIAQL